MYPQHNVVDFLFAWKNQTRGRYDITEGKFTSKKGLNVQIVIVNGWHTFLVLVDTILAADK